jgi:hypothetical protein
VRSSMAFFDCENTNPLERSKKINKNLVFIVAV